MVFRLLPISMTLNDRNATSAALQYHAATAVLGKDHFPILYLESGMAYRLRSDNLLHWTALSAT